MRKEKEEEEEGGGGGRRERREEEKRGGHLSPRQWPHPAAWGVRRQVCGRWCRVVYDGGWRTTASFEFFHSEPSISVHLIGQKIK